MNNIGCFALLIGLLIGITGLIYVIWGWIGAIICLGIVVVIILVIILLIWFILYSFGSAFSYSDKEIGKTIKSFLGYDFGNEYEVIVNEVRGHQDMPVKFVIKIPQDTMQNVIEYCKSSGLGKCSAKEFTKEFTKKDTEFDYPEWSENLIVKFDECTIEYSAVSF